MKRNFHNLWLILLMLIFFSFTVSQNIIITARTTIKNTTVHNAQQLVNALQSNAVIQLEPGNYDLNQVKDKPPYFRKKCISNIKNLTIVGNGKTYIRIITADLYAPVLQFKNCETITLRNLNIGHVPAQDGCRGNVVEISESKDITIDKCIMFGCGINGLSLTQVQDFNCKNSTIKECSESIMGISKSQNVVFDNCKFVDNKGNYIRTGDCQNVLFKNSLIIGKEMTPYFEDSNQYAVLTDEGTISGEYYRYTSAHVVYFKDWLSNVTLQNIWISNKANYQLHRKTHALLRKIFNKALITTNITKDSLEINLNIIKSELKYSNICNSIRKLIQAEDIIKDQKFKLITVKIYTDQLNVIDIKGARTNIIKYLSDSNPLNLEKYGKLMILAVDVEPKVFWENNENYLSGKDAIEKLSALMELKTAVKDESYVNGPEFQRFKYIGASKEKDQLFHYIELEQKLPLLGDFIHYATFAEFRINALTGVVIIKEPLLGECKVYKVDKDLQEDIIGMVKDRQFESHKIKLGTIQADKSLFIGLKDEPDAKVVKVQLFNAEGGAHYVIFTLTKQNAVWAISKEQVPDVKQGEVGD